MIVPPGRRIVRGTGRLSGLPDGKLHVSGARCPISSAWYARMARHQPHASHYRVKHGDTLWSIAKQQYGRVTLGILGMTVDIPPTGTPIASERGIVGR
jgi:LysM domain-containing protein